jgi:HD-GYP domain-containing protein (c-di-GMP phosphodiesterase class II)
MLYVTFNKTENIVRNNYKIYFFYALRAKMVRNLLIRVSDLKPGMIVTKTDKEGIYFPYYGAPIENDEPIKLLIESGVERVFIRVDVNDLPAEKKPERESVIITELQKQTDPNIDFSIIKEFAPTIEEVIKAETIHKRTKEVTKKVLTDVRMGKTLDTSATKEVVNELVLTCLNSPNVFPNMTRLKDFDDYTFTHSLNVSIISIAIGRRLGKSPSELNLIGTAGIMHDLGKMKIPEKILNKPDKLTDEEFRIMKQHPVRGYDLLKYYSKLPEDVLLSVLQHHEKADGSGYPGGINEKQINPMAKIIAIADVYDAVTSDRVYHQGKSPAEALKLIFEGSGKHFNETLVKFFINIMGIYPVGTLTMLDTHEMAVVFDSRQDDILKPVVIVISNEKGTRVQPYLLDLKNQDSSTSTKKIISSIKSDSYGVDTNGIIESFVKEHKLAHPLNK